MKPRTRKLLLAAALLATLLVGLRLALPDWIRDELNQRLDHMGAYHGHISTVELELWAGGYALEGLTITKRTAEVPVPFFSGERIDITLSWKALLHGSVVAQATFHQPVLNFVDDKGDATQSGAGVNWREKLEQLVPIRIDEITLHDGTVHFRNYSTEPVVDQAATQVEGKILNLTNVRDESGRVASYDLTAKLFGEAPLTLEGTADPFAVLQDFHYRLLVDSVSLADLNEFLQAYARLDVESGHGTFLMELEAHDGQLVGYAKPLFQDIQVFSWKSDVEEEGDGPLRAFWEALVGGVENLFKNQQLDQLATIVEIRGELGDADTSTWQVIAGILKNAFVAAYLPLFESLPERPDNAEDETA